MFSQYDEQAKTVYMNNIATDMIVKCGLSLLWLSGKMFYLISLPHFLPLLKSRCSCSGTKILCKASHELFGSTAFVWPCHIKWWW